MSVNLDGVLRFLLLRAFVLAALRARTAPAETWSFWGQGNRRKQAWTSSGNKSVRFSNFRKRVSPWRGGLIHTVIHGCSRSIPQRRQRWSEARPPTTLFTLSSIPRPGPRSADEIRDVKSFESFKPLGLQVAGMTTHETRKFETVSIFDFSRASISFRFVCRYRVLETARFDFLKSSRGIFHSGSV